MQVTYLFGTSDYSDSAFLNVLFYLYLFMIYFKGIEKGYWSQQKGKEKSR